MGNRAGGLGTAVVERGHASSLFSLLNSAVSPLSLLAA